MQTLKYDIDADGIATLTFDEQGSPVNTMTLQWQQELGEAVAMLERDKAQLRGVLLASAKTTFFAGAELKGVLQEWMILQRDFLPLPIPPANAQAKGKSTS